jgi:hypothetical protein
MRPTSTKQINFQFTCRQLTNIIIFSSGTSQNIFSKHFPDEFFAPASAGRNISSGS